MVGGKWAGRSRDICGTVLVANISLWVDWVRRYELGCLLALDVVVNARARNQMQIGSLVWEYRQANTILASLEIR